MIQAYHSHWPERVFFKKLIKRKRNEVRRIIADKREYQSDCQS